MPHCVGCCTTELLSGGFWLLVMSSGESVGLNQAMCLQTSGLSNAACVELLVPKYVVKLEIVFKKHHFCILHI